MQGLGSYRHGKMLFLGLGTGLDPFAPSEADSRVGDFSETAAISEEWDQSLQRRELQAGDNKEWKWCENAHGVQLGPFPGSFLA